MTRTIHDPDSAVTYTPATGPNGELGFACMFDDGRPTEFLMLNPSHGSTDGVPTVFVYQGLSPDVNESAAVVHFEVGGTGLPGTDQPAREARCPECESDQLATDDLCPGTAEARPQMIDGKVDVNYQGTTNYGDGQYSVGICCEDCGWGVVLAGPDDTVENLFGMLCKWVDVDEPAPVLAEGVSS